MYRRRGSRVESLIQKAIVLFREGAFSRSEGTGQLSSSTRQFASIKGSLSRQVLSHALADHIGHRTIHLASMLFECLRLFFGQLDLGSNHGVMITVSGA